MTEKKLPEYYKKTRNKRILKRVIYLLLSWIIFYLAYFYLPIPNNMKRSFGKDDCHAKGGQWVEEKTRCLQGPMKSKQ